MKEPDDDEVVEKALSDEAIDLSRKMLADADATKGRDMRYRIRCLSILCEVFLKRNELTEETEGLLHQLVTRCIAENNLNRKHVHDSFIFLHAFYLKIHESSRMGEETILVQKNIELCQKKLLELESCNDGSVVLCLFT